MTEKDNHNIFTAADIQRYVNGEMPAAEMHALESAALEDPFLADAIEGYAATIERKDTNISGDISDLQGRLHQRVRTADRSAVPFFSWSKIAAVLILLAGIGSLVYYLLGEQRQRKTYMSQQRASGTKSNTSESASGNTPDTTAVATKDAADTSLQNGLLFNKQEEQPAVALSRQQAKTSAPNQASTQRSAEAESSEAFKKDIAYSSANKPGTGAAPALKARTIREKAGATDTNYFSGQVTGSENKAVPAATVSILNSERRKDVKADSNGKFNFSSEDSVATVVVNSIGYEGSVSKISSKNKDTNISLKDSLKAHTELASNSPYPAPSQRARYVTPDVVGTNARPVNGWKAYNTYLNTNKKVPLPQANVHGSVLITFKINRNGRPGNFQVVKSLNELLDAEAIRLVKEGPDWKIIKDDQSPMRLTIRF